LEIKDLSVRYGRRSQDALRKLNFQLRGGECIGLLGENGSGKSTLLKSMSRILSHREDIYGQVLIDGVNLFDLSLSQIPSILSYLPSEWRVAFPLKVWEYVGLSAQELHPRELKNRVKEVL